MANVKIGDEVHILCRLRRRSNQVPENGHLGTVTKVGRKYATATWTETWKNFNGTETSQRARDIEFNMETGDERDSRFGYYVRTPEQLAREQRRSEALAIIKDRGLEFRHSYGERHRTLEQLEALAELVKTWDEAE